MLEEFYRRLGEILGKGGWGVVYKGFNLQAGDFVAIKQVQLTKLPKDQLAGIMSEISLLQALRHPRIVKYIDSIKTDEALYIVLEYVENGSLERIVSKFGAFPEHLIAVYIKQVLEGLVYLHEQGVIHRDIKGANILTTKDGHIKLADFGIATKQDAGSDDIEEPAGSPYWMAPEIIEMNPASTKADIWSVGCTIIELSTGTPPYFDLDPMPAMFKIVSDDSPPIPENLSPGLKDFLMQCFQKEPLLRLAADKLLKHKWLLSTIKKTEQTDSNQPSSPTGNRGLAVQEVVQDYNKKVKEKRENILHSPIKSPNETAANGSNSARKEGTAGSSKSSSSKTKDKSHRRVESKVGTSGGDSSRDKKARRHTSSKRSDRERKEGEKDKSPSKDHSHKHSKTKTAKLREFKEVVVDDDWDDDFGTAEAKAPSPAVPTPASALNKSNDSNTSKASDHSQPGSKVTKFVEKDDDEDWATDFDDEKPAPKPNVNGATPAPKPQPAITVAAAQVRPKSPQKPSTVSKFKEDDDDDWDDDFGPNTPRSGSSSTSTSVNSSASKVSGPSTLGTPLKTSAPAPTKPLSKVKSYSESDSKKSDDDWDDFDLGDNTAAASSKKNTRDRPSGGVDLSARLKAKLDQAWDEKPEVVEDDLFDAFDSDDDEFNQEEALLKDELSKLTTEATNAFLDLQPELPEATILKACTKLVKIFKEHSALKSNLISQTGVIPLIEMLRSCSSSSLEPISPTLASALASVPPMSSQSLTSSSNSPLKSSSGSGGSKMTTMYQPIPTLPNTNNNNIKIVDGVLKVVNNVIEGNVTLAESFCVMGGIPSTLRYAGRVFERHIRQEVLAFIQQVLKLGKKTVKMFIASGGLPVLGEYLDIVELMEYNDEKDLIFGGINCIYDVLTLNLQIHIPKKDFCRLLAKAGLLPKLVSVLAFILDDTKLPTSEQIYYADKIAEIWTIFSNADPIVKLTMCEVDLMKRLLRQLEKMKKQPSIFGKFVKSIKTLSSLVTTLENLYKAGAIKTLVPLMHEPWSVEISSNIISALCNLCRLDKKRQSDAAKAGILPMLIACINNNSTMKQFALQIMYEFARNKKTRDLLYKSGGIKFYLGLFHQPFPWAQIQAIDALAEWLADDPKRVAPVLEENYMNFVQVFSAAKDETLASMVEPLHRILTLSTPLSASLSTSSFLPELLSKRKHHNPHVRVYLLKLLRCLLEATRNPKECIRKHGLDSVVSAMESDSRVLVSQIARDISQAIQRAKAGGSVRSPSLTNISQ